MRELVRVLRATQVIAVTVRIDSNVNASALFVFTVGPPGKTQMIQLLPRTLGPPPSASPAYRTVSHDTCKLG
eukprot:757725-Hanusia_phi.AAC.5